MDTQAFNLFTDSTETLDAMVTRRRIGGKRVKRVSRRQPPQYGPDTDWTAVPDKGLVVVARANGPGSQAAARALVERHAGLFRTVAREYAPDPGQIEDLEQECRIHLLTHLESYDASRPVGPWMQTVIRNCARNYRRSARRWRLVPMDDSAPETPGHDRPVCESLGDGEIALQLRQYVSELPDIYHQVIVRRYYREEPCESIAQDLAIPVGTVKNRLFRARRLLETRLEKTDAA